MSLDVRTCEACGEARHCDDGRRCAQCECWSCDGCVEWITDDDGEYFDSQECCDDYHAKNDGPDPLSSTARDAFNQ